MPQELHLFWRLSLVMTAAGAVLSFARMKNAPVQMPLLLLIDIGVSLLLTWYASIGRRRWARTALVGLTALGGVLALFAALQGVLDGWELLTAAAGLAVSVELLRVLYLPAVQHWYDADAPRA